MKIIDKFKDYYDYVVYQYGIDNNIVLDRRNYSSNSLFEGRYIFDKYVYDWSYYFIIEIGFVQYLFKQNYDYDISNKNRFSFVKKIESGVNIFSIQCERWRKEKMRRIYKENGINSDKHNKAEAINLYVIPYSNIRDIKNFEKASFDDFVNYSRLWQAGIYLTEMAAFFPAQEVYDNIYNYLISLKEPKIEDKRSDIDKLISKGFDKKTSFRKM